MSKRDKQAIRYALAICVACVLAGVAAYRTVNPQAHGVIATVKVDWTPQLAAVDERTGHTFVVTWTMGPDSGTPVADGRMITLDTRTGAILAKAHVGTDSIAMAVDSRRGRVFVVNADNSDTTPSARGSVSVLDTHSGGLLRRVAVGRYPYAVGIDEATDRVFVANQYSGTISMLDAQSGRLLRTVRVGTDLGALLIDERTNRVYLTVGPGTALRVLDAQTGTVTHTIKVSRVAVASSVAGGLGALNEQNDRIFVFLADGSLRVVDTRRDVVLRPSALTVPPFTAIVVDDVSNYLFASSQREGTILMLDATKGTLLRVIKVHGGPGDIGIDRQLHRLFVANVGDGMHNGTIDVLDTRTGATLDTIMVGIDPGLVVDAQRQRVIVVNTASGTVSIVDAGVSHAVTK